MENIKDLGRLTFDFTQSGDMIFATSPDVSGLMVTGRSMQVVFSRLCGAMDEINAMKLSTERRGAGKE